MLSDPMQEPSYGWRVPYVIIWGHPSAPLKDLVASPEDALTRGGDKRINHIYYITKCINPSLERIFKHCGVNINQWYMSCYRPTPIIRRFSYSSDKLTQNEYSKKKSNKKYQSSITSFTYNYSCEICGLFTNANSSFCNKCIKLDGANILLKIIYKLNENLKKETNLNIVCQNCAKFPQSAIYGDEGKKCIIGKDTCMNLDCNYFYERAKLVLRIEDLQVAENEIVSKLNK